MPSGVHSHVCVLSCFSRVWLCETPWTVARQVPLSMGFSRQEYWSGLPCPPPGDLSDPGIKPVSLTLHVPPALAGRFFTTSATWEALHSHNPEETVPSKVTSELLVVKVIASWSSTSWIFLTLQQCRALCSPPFDTLPSWLFYDMTLSFYSSPLSNLFFFFFGHPMQHTGIEFVSPALETWSLNHWTIREVPLTVLKESREEIEREIKIPVMKN